MKLTDEDIEGLIAAEYWTTGKEAFEDCPMLPSVETLTICLLVLKNGFVITGTSNCLNPANFNAELGQKIARQNAKDKIWELEGYRVRSNANG